MLCTDTCGHAYDGQCDDGGTGAVFSLCALGTDFRLRAWVRSHIERLASVGEERIRQRDERIRQREEQTDLWKR